MLLFVFLFRNEIRAAIIEQERAEEERRERTDARDAAAALANECVGDWEGGMLACRLAAAVLADARLVAAVLADVWLAAAVLADVWLPSPFDIGAIFPLQAQSRINEAAGRLVPAVDQVCPLDEIFAPSPSFRQAQASRYNPRHTSPLARPRYQHQLEVNDEAILDQQKRMQERSEQVERVRSDMLAAKGKVTAMRDQIFEAERSHEDAEVRNCVGSFHAKRRVARRCGNRPLPFCSSQLAIEASKRERLGRQSEMERVARQYDFALEEYKRVSLVQPGREDSGWDRWK